MGSVQSQSELYSPEFAEHWPRFPLYDLAVWVNGMAFKNFQFSDRGLPVVKIAEIKSGITSQTKFTEAEYDPKYLLESDDILFCWSGQPETSIDTFRWQGPSGWLNQHIFKVLPKAELVDRNFFFHLLRYLKPVFIRIARNKQTTGLGHVTQGDLKQLMVGLPPIAEQRQLAARLDAIEEKIESNHSLQDGLESLAHAQFSQLFSTEHDPDGVKVSELIQINPGRKLTRGVDATYLGMSALPEFSAEVYNWDTRVFTAGQKFINGDVLLARITPCLENGKTAVVDMLAEGEVGWGSTEFVVLAPTPDYSTSWIYCFVRSEPVREFAIRSMTGSSGRQRFQASSLASYKIEQPKELELAEFGRVAAPIFDKLTQIRNENRALGALRASLNPEIMAGRIRPVIPIPEAVQ